MSRVPHYLDNQLTDGGEVVSLLCLLPFTTQENSWYSILLEAQSTIVWLEGRGKLKKVNELIGTGIRYLLTCSILPQSGISLNTETLNWGFKTS
jgi:hypothetical protein